MEAVAEEVGGEEETCGGAAVVDPAVVLAAAREDDCPGGFKQLSTAATAAAIVRASNRSSGVFEGAVLSFDGVWIVGIVVGIVDTGEAAPSPSVTLAFGWEVGTDVVGVV